MTFGNYSVAAEAVLRLRRRLTAKPSDTRSERPRRADRNSSAETRTPPEGGALRELLTEVSVSRAARYGDEQARNQRDRARTTPACRVRERIRQVLNSEESIPKDRTRHRKREL